MRPCHICAGTGGSPLPHLRQDWGLTPATSATGLGSSSASASLSASRASSAASSVSIARARCLLTGSGTGERCTIARARASHTQWCLNVKHACRARSSGLQNATRNAQCATASACAGRAAQRSAALRTPGPSAVLVRNMWQRCAPSRCRCGNRRGVTRAAGVRRTMAVALHGTGSSRRAKARCRRDGGCGGGRLESPANGAVCCMSYDVARDMLHVVRCCT